MFNKSTDQTAAPSGSGSGSGPARVSNVKSIFASDLKITGEVSSLGDIEMMGEVDGNITARTVSVGSDGRMTGTITAETVDVRGKLDGQISAGTFTLRAAAQVAADITYRSLVIESGAQIEGRFAKLKG